MTRDDVPGVALAAVVGAGLLWNLLGPHGLGGVIAPVGGIAGVAAWAAAVALGAVGVPAWWWGPVRVGRPPLRWMLSGPTDRGPVLRRTLLCASGVAVIADTAAGFVIGALAVLTREVG